MRREYGSDTKAADFYAEVLGLMVNSMQNQTDIETIAASTMAENQALGNVLKKNGFDRVAHALLEWRTRDSFIQ